MTHPAGAPVPGLPVSPPPQPLGLSELFSGGPVTPDSDFGYFPAFRSEPSSLNRPGPSRRPPVISPFRSYYGELRLSGSFPDQTGHRDTSSKPSTPSPDKTESGTSPSPKASSDGGFSSYLSNSGLRSPRIRNEDSSNLAPHGSFTSARARTPTVPSSRSSVASSEGTRQARETLLSRVNVGDMSSIQKDALMKAATKGDQLAMHHLGLLPTREADKRYSIGSVENVWGPSDIHTTSTRRSSASSQGSAVSGSASLPAPPGTSTSLNSTTTARYYIVPDDPGLPEPGIRHHNVASDLFSDAARMALRSNAGLQNRRPSAVDPPLDSDEPKKHLPGGGKPADTLGKAHGDNRPKHRRAPSHLL